MSPSVVMSPRILVVADDAALRTQLDRVLQHAGFTVRAAVSGGDLEDVHAAFAPQLVLVDQSPSDAAALQAATRLRKLQRNLPVLFLGTGKQSVRSAIDAIRHQGDDYLQRPLPVEQLLHRVARYLSITPPEVADGSLVIPGDAPSTLPQPATPPASSPAAMAQRGAAVAWAPVPSAPGQPQGQRPAFASFAAFSPAPMVRPVDLLSGGFSAAVGGGVFPVRPLNPPEGAIPDGAMAALLWACFSQRITGRLDLFGPGGPETEKSLYLEDGQVLALRSKAPADRLENHLLALGYLTPAQVRAAQARTLVSPRQTAAALLEDGALKAQEVFVVTREHLKDRVAALLEAGGGGFRYVADTAPELERVALDVPPQALVWQGIRRKFPLHRLQALLGGPDTLVVPQQAVDLGDVGLDAVESRAMRALDGAHTLEDVALSVGVPLERVYQVAYLLLCAGAARVGARGHLGIQPAGGGVDLHLDRARLMELHRRSQEASYFDLLGVRPDASRADIEAALHALQSRLTPVRDAGPALQDLRPLVEELSLALEEAASVLLHDTLRQRYKTALSHP